MSQLLPIFPLDTVLLPGAALPLRIFEPRYRALIADLRGDAGTPPDDAGFGVISVTHPDGLLERPAATELAGVGTYAAIVELEMLEDGGSEVLTVGRRRFRILAVEPTGKPYLQASVEWLPELRGHVPAALADAARVGCARYLSDLADLVGRDRPVARFSSDPVTLSYQVAGRIRLATGERRTLLEAADAGDRLRMAVRLLRREVVLMARTQSVAVSPGQLQLDTQPN